MSRLSKQSRAVQIRSPQAIGAENDTRGRPEDDRAAVEVVDD
jgi:hypothetical protein